MKQLTLSLVGIFISGFLNIGSADSILNTPDPLLTPKSTSKVEKSAEEETKERVVNQVGVILLKKTGSGSKVLMGEADGYYNYKHFTPFERTEDIRISGPALPGGAPTQQVLSGRIIPMLGFPTRHPSNEEKKDLLDFVSNVLKRKTADSVKIKSEEFLGTPTIYSKSQKALFYLLRDDSLSVSKINSVLHDSRKGLRKKKGYSKANYEFSRFRSISVTKLLRAARCAKNKGYPKIHTSCYQIKLDKMTSKVNGTVKVGASIVYFDKYYIDAIGRDYKNAKEGFEKVFDKKF